MCVRGVRRFVEEEKEEEDLLFRLGGEGGGLEEDFGGGGLRKTGSLLDALERVLLPQTR